MSKILLDIGSHNGTVSKTLLGCGFDKFYCFEPQQALWAHYDNNPHLTLCPFGLGKYTGKAKLFRGGTLGSASTYREKEFKGPIRETTVDMVKASDWFRENLNRADFVIAKMNCEGSECDILEDLLESGEYIKLAGLAVTFDLLKVPGQEERVQRVYKEVLIRIPRVWWINNYRAYRGGSSYIWKWFDYLTR